MGEIKPVRDEADYQAALAEVERLWGSRSGTPEGDRLDVLATLVDAYENEHEPIDPPDPIEAIKFRMEQQGLTRKDLEKVLGTRARIAEVLNGRRSLSISMIRRLHDALGISAEVLIRPCSISKQPRDAAEKMAPIRQLIYDATSTQLSGREFTRQDLISVLRMCNKEIHDNSVLPSDYLCSDALKPDPSNTGNREKLRTYPRFLERVGRNRYRFVGWDGIAEGSLDAPILRKVCSRSSF